MGGSKDKIIRPRLVGVPRHTEGAVPLFCAMASMFGARRAMSTAALAVLAACSPSPVRWASDRTVQTSAATEVLASDGVPVPDSLASLRTRMVPPSPVCAGSLRIARSGAIIFATWWSPRTDSSALLASASTKDEGATWTAVAPVDTSDRGRTGCARNPPSIAADAASGYVHVSYAMLAAEGPGIFFAHSMDGGATFHSPVPIVYGEVLGRTSVAAAGDLVAVAFEDPNSRTPRIGLALSGTMGHIFEDRLLPVSDDNGAATHPLVAVQQRRLSVAWQEQGASSGRVMLHIRTGTIP